MLKIVQSDESGSGNGRACFARPGLAPCWATIRDKKTFLLFFHYLEFDHNFAEMLS